MLFVLSKGNKFLANSQKVVSRMFDLHRFSRRSPFLFLNPPRLLVGNTCIYVSSYLLLLGSYD